MERVGAKIVKALWTTPNNFSFNKWVNITEAIFKQGIGVIKFFLPRKDLGRRIYNKLEWERILIKRSETGQATVRQEKTQDWN